MNTEHRILFSDSSRMPHMGTESVHLVITSPPYPMIEMWDGGFCRRPEIKAALDNGDESRAFELMHRELDRVWDELMRVMVPGGIVCINIGDATRTLNETFALFSNHSRVLSHMLAVGFTNLPNILWRKPTNAPNKFMGSGMMPPGAYVTLEHEYILLFRKGGKRQFVSPEDKRRRRQSAFFWEERNRWFSDIWTDLAGARQITADNGLRRRSAAYPFELPYRLICMFSLIGDTVLDPFLGTGTTTFAAAAACRNSVGYEKDSAFRPAISSAWAPAIEQARRRIGDRVADHVTFVHDREKTGKAVRYTNRTYGFPVVTRQETELMLPLATAVDETEPDLFCVSYDLPELSGADGAAPDPKRRLPRSTGQLKLFT